MVIKKLYNRLTTFIQTGSSRSVIGFSRSLLAAGMLLKFVFNNINVLIPLQKLQTLDVHTLKYRCNFFLLFNPSHLAGMQIAAILILLILLSGYFMKITSLLHFWIAASFLMLQPVTGSVVRLDMLLSLLLIPVCLFDDRKNHWQRPVISNKPNTRIQNIFLFLIKLQVAFIYYDSFHDKLFIKEWLNGTVIYYWFTHNFFGLHPSLITLLQPILTSIPVLLFIAWGTLAFEALLAIALLFPSRFRLSLLKCAVLFHFCIVLIHGFAFIFLGISAALFLYLYPAGKSFSFTIFNENLDG